MCYSQARAKNGLHIKFGMMKERIYIWFSFKSSSRDGFRWRFLIKLVQLQEREKTKRKKKKKIFQLNLSEFIIIAFFYIEWSEAAI